MTYKQTRGIRVLLDWANKHDPESDNNYAEQYWNQITFVSDDLIGALACDLSDQYLISEMLMVVGEYAVGSLTLPVYKLVMIERVVFYLKCDFHHWTVSVDAPFVVELPDVQLFDPTNQIPYYFCEGFPREKVFDCYANNKRQFTFEIKDDYQLFVYFWLYAVTMRGKRIK